MNGKYTLTSTGVFFFLKIKSYFNHRANGNHDLFQEGENPRKLMIGFALT